MSNDQILDSAINADLSKEEVDVIDVSKFFILFFLSLGLYGIWWMYKTWRFFRDKENLDIYPAARAIFSIFFIYALFEKIQSYAKSSGYIKGYSSGFLTVAFIIFNFTTRLPDPFWVMGFFSVFCFIQPVSALNFAIENSDTYTAKRGGFNNRQLAIVVVGAILWALIIIGLVMPE
jgi:hypothetical protein